MKIYSNYVFINLVYKLPCVYRNLFTEASADTSMHADGPALTLLFRLILWTPERDEIIVGNVPPESLFHVFTQLSQAEMDLKEHS